MKSIEIDGYTCLVGQSAKENWDILGNARQTDIFFHLSKFPSCYVILCTPIDVSDVIIRKVARICKENTKYGFRVSIDYTQCNNVIKGTKVGEVIYKSNRRVKRIVV
jgi:predicted ribosome quality control (RQC) complex YloA/Tae2 family protein